MNKLQGIVHEIGTENDKVVRDLLAQLEKDLNVDKAFKDVDYYARVKSNFADGVVDSMAHGTWQTSYIIDEVKSRNWYMFTDHQGGNLSETIRTAGADKAIKDVISKSFKLQTSAGEIARKLPKVGQTGKLPAVVTDMVDQYRRLGADSTEVRRALARLDKYVKAGTKENVSNALQKSYADVAKAIRRNDKALLAKAMNKAATQKVNYINSRIARTEVARAYNMSTNRVYKEDDRVIGWRWLLSPAHPRADICDYCAESNEYNMGSGVYPVGAGPSIPAHPNCLCMSEPVLRRSDRSIGRSSATREQEAQDKIVKRGYSEKRLKKEIGTLNNNGRNMVPKSIISEK